MGWFGQTGSAPSCEDLAILIQAAGEDAGLRRQLVVVLRQGAFHRKSMLNAFLEELRLRHAPTGLKTAVACLLDDALAEEALRLLTVSSPDA